MTDEVMAVSTPDQQDGIVHVADGEWLDPRITITGTVDELFPTKTNAKGRKQASARVLMEDGSAVLVSGFNEDCAKVRSLKLGHVYELRGILKKKGESTYLNLR